jgi:hypothetical protein
MPELILKENIAKKIEDQVARLHKDLGNPDPPINLENIRELLRLDKRFYTDDDPNILDRVFHKIILAGKQIVERPTRIWDAIREFNVKALWVPDEKVIFINPYQKRKNGGQKLMKSDTRFCHGIRFFFMGIQTVPYLLVVKKKSNLRQIILLDRYCSHKPFFD